MTILVTGVTGLANRGVEALVSPVVANLRQLFADEDVRVLTGTPEEDALHGDAYGCTFERDPFRRGFRLRQPLADRALRSLQRRTHRWRSIQEAISNATMIVSIGGDVFSSEYGGQTVHLEPLRIAVDNGVPVVFLAHSIGPYRTPKEASEWLKVARRAAIVTLREELSYAYVKNTLELRGPRIELTADPGFLLTPADAGMSSAHLAYYGPAGDGPLVGIVPSRGISRFTGLGTSGHETAGRHLQAWIEVIRYLIDRIEARVLLVPHVQVPGINDDPVICDAIVRGVGYDPRVKVAWGDLRAHEYKGLLAKCSLVIAERMHAAIGALSTNVPTLLVGYSVKAEGVLRQVYGGDDALSHCLISFEQFLTPAVAIKQVQMAWEAREDTRALLEENIPAVRARAQKNFEIIRQTIGSA